MKKSIALVLLTSVALLSGCASTGSRDDSPIISTQFEPIKGASFARNAMLLAGSKKFVDSKDGIENTRTVAGGSAATALNIATFDFVGAISNSLTNSIIENEPLAKGTNLILTMPITQLSLSPEEQESVRNKAFNRYKEILSSAGVSISNIIDERKNYQKVVVNDDVCELKQSKYIASDTKCQLFLEKGKILRITSINGSPVAVVKFKVPFSNLIFRTAQFLGDNEFLYIAPKMGRKVAMVMPRPVVLNKNKAHFFTNNSTEEHGKPLTEIDMYWYVDKSLSATGTDMFFKVDMKSFKLVPLKE